MQSYLQHFSKQQKKKKKFQPLIIPWKHPHAQKLPKQKDQGHQEVKTALFLSGRALNSMSKTPQFFMEETPGQRENPRLTKDLGLLGFIKNFQGDFCMFPSSTCLRYFLVQQGLSHSGNHFKPDASNSLPPHPSAPPQGNVTVGILNQHLF